MGLDGVNIHNDLWSWKLSSLSIDFGGAVGNNENLIILRIEI